MGTPFAEVTLNIVRGAEEKNHYIMHSGKSTWQWKMEHTNMYFCISYCDVLVYQSESMIF